MVVTIVGFIVTEDVFVPARMQCKCVMQTTDTPSFSLATFFMARFERLRDKSGVGMKF